MTDGTELCRLTVDAPGRRIDVALPDRPALAELLPDLLRHAGPDLADSGQAHGGWVLRRGDGTSLAVGSGLAAQGVRDGDVLYLAPARSGWPELAYDDMADAVAAAAHDRGRPWDGAATRAAALSAAGVILLVGAVLLVRGPDPVPVALAAGTGLLLAAGVASRGYGEGAVGTVLAGYAQPYAFLAGLFALPAAPGSARLLVASSALLVAGVLGGIAIGYPDAVSAAAVTMACAGLAGALLGALFPAAQAAAVLLASLAVGLAGVPLLAVRLGRLPVPVPGGEAANPPAGGIHSAVVRTDRLLTGLLAGYAAAAFGAALVLAGTPGWASVLLVLAAGGAFALRARSVAAVRHRVPLLAAGGVSVPVLIGPLWTVWLAARAIAPAVMLGVALLLAAAAVVYRKRAPGPYLGRAADLIDALCVVCVLPLAAQVLGLYARMRGLIT